MKERTVLISNGEESQETHPWMSWFCEKPPLSREEAAKLAKRIKKGDEPAAKKLVEHNLRLVVTIAKGFTDRGLPLSDLVQEGAMGLITAAKTFDPEKGAITTHGGWWIRQAMWRALAKQARTIRLPEHIITDKYPKISKAQRLLLYDLGREPTPEEISDETDLPVETVNLVICSVRKQVSLDEKLESDGDVSFKDTIVDTSVRSPADEASRTLLKEGIGKAFSSLTEREQAVLNLRFGLEDGICRTLEEIAQMYKVTRERVRQLEAKALRKLRHPARLRHLVGEDEKKPPGDIIGSAATSRERFRRPPPTRGRRKK